MALTEQQQKYFFDNYLIIPLGEIAKNIDISLPNLDYFVLKLSVVTLREKCKVFLKRTPTYVKVYKESKEDKREIKCFWYEPKFTSEELESYNHSLIDPKYINLKSNSESINGKQCTIFQSRMNH